MKHPRWRELFERLPPEIQAEVNGNTAKVLAELNRAEQEQRDERSHDDEPDPTPPVTLNR